MDRFEENRRRMEIIDKVTERIDKKIINESGNEFNDLVQNILNSSKNSCLDPRLKKIRKPKLYHIIEAAQIIRDSGKEEEVVKKYRSEKYKYIYYTMREYIEKN